MNRMFGNYKIRWDIAINGLGCFWLVGYYQNKIIGSMLVIDGNNYIVITENNERCDFSDIHEAEKWLIEKEINHA